MNSMLDIVIKYDDSGHLGQNSRMVATKVLFSTMMRLCICKSFAFVYSGVMEDFKKLLRDSGFRATPGRISLLQSLYRARKPLTVDELAGHLNLNIVTLYRALSELADSGLLLRGLGSGDAMHFSYPKNHHHHMVCTDCGYSTKCKVC